MKRSDLRAKRRRSAGWLAASAALLALWPLACAEDAVQPVSEPANHTPVLVDSLPSLELVPPDSAVLDLSAHFRDPEGDSLTYGATSIDPTVAKATVVGSVLTVVAVGRGTTEVSVTARDPGGLAAVQGFRVAVPNQPPLPTDSLAALELFAFDTVAVDLRAHFSDPDEDVLSYAIESSDPETATAYLSGHTVTIAALRPGDADVTVTAQDPTGLAATQSFAVTVPNRQPLVTGTIRRQPVLPGQSVTLGLSDYFSDLDGHELAFTALTSDSRVATATLSGATARIASVGPGTAEITFIARDPGALSTALSFLVNVPANPDRDALVALYEASDGPNWRRQTNWLSAAPLGSWAGIEVNEGGRVTRVRLNTNGLVGPIPPEIGWLAELAELNLGHNNLKGAIPPEVGELTRLDELDLSYTGLTGSIPAGLGRLRGLRTLRLLGNRLTGPIPPELGNLASLTSLLLGSNVLTGSIPPELASLAELTRLGLNGNRLTGPIPPGLGNLSKMKYLFLDRNSLTGPIPPTLGRLGGLLQLSLEQNRLDGPIPAELGRLHSLTQLELEGNQLTGPIPPELGQMEALHKLSLRFNRLTGSIPPELGALETLEDMLLDHNNLEGPIPPELGDLRNLDALWLHNNRLTGFLPAALGDLHNLRWLLVYGNALSGPLPRSLLRLEQLEVLYIAANDGLCVPGVADFVAWTEARARNPLALCIEKDIPGLTALFESTGGADWIESRGWLGGSLLESRHGVVTDSAGRIVEIDLRKNGLSGRLPPEVGEFLNNLEVLRVGGNGLSGPLPRSLVDLRLREFDYADTELCVPPDESFKSWLEAIPVRRGSLSECPVLSLREREILVRLYEATDGDNWTDNSNWLTDAPLRSWYGVSVALSSGRVDAIFLSNNGLSGRIPPELAGLSGLTQLWLDANDLKGSIPAELGNLPELEWLRLESNSLSGSIPPALGKLAQLRALHLQRNRLTGTVPAELGALESLETLDLSWNDLRGNIPSEISGLQNLYELDLSGNNLSGSIPPELGRLGSLTRLYLHDSGLTGRIPAELGALRSLRHLYLDNNRLVGPIPPELGRLRSLQRLILSRNQLSGPLPPELKGLSRITIFALEDNSLGGPIPPELGHLTSLASINLEGNNLTGAIPPELGALGSLQGLRLSGNNLAGPIPPELGRLHNVWKIELHDNELTGGIPAEFGNLPNLEWLTLAGNTGLGGPLPPTLSRLGSLGSLDLDGTNFCAADDFRLLNWLYGNGVARMPLCMATARAWLTQAVQSRVAPVPLVAGEEALLRVSVTARQVNAERIPPVRASFLVNGREVYSTEIPGRSGPIPTRVDESSLENSVNARIPGDVVQPGLEMVIEVDPEGVLDPALGVDRRIPATGRLSVEVAKVPPLSLTVIPFLWSEDPDSTIIGTVREMAADPDSHELLWDTRTLLPVNELDVTAHEPVLSSDNNPYRLFYQTVAIRALEGENGHYLGMLAGERINPLGLGYAPGAVSFSVASANVIAHELGHNLSLLHAPCGGPKSLDPGFPQIDGSIGAPGYDFREGGGLVDSFTSDLMSYCDPHWISEYGFTTALRYRLRSEAEGALRASPTRSLLLWGGIDTDGSPFQEPAFVVDAPPRLPDAGAGGDYRLEGLDAAGRVLFSLAFDIARLADGEGAGAFAFVLPSQPEWEDALAAIELSGPDGSAILSQDSGAAAAILLDSRSRQVRGILRGLSGDPRVQADAIGPDAGTGLEILFSRGIPDAVAWGR